MNNRVYMPVSEQIVKHAFFKYASELNLPSIDYVAVGIQDTFTKTSTSLMSRADWQTHFVANQYASFDPLRKAAMNTQRNIILFDEIDYQDSYGSEIMSQRSKFGMNNGIVLLERTEGQNIIITLATGYKGFDAMDFIQNHLSAVKAVARDLSNIITNSN